MKGIGKRIYVLTDTTQKARRDKLTGIYAYAHTRGWIIRTLEITHSTNEFRHALGERPPDGLVFDGCLPQTTILRTLHGRIPTVAIDLPPRQVPAGALLVHHDDIASARMAAESLLNLDLKTFATLDTIQPRHWSAPRTRAFSAAIRKAGHRCFILRRQTAEVFGSVIHRWLRDLPKPCGIFAPTDSIAKIVIDICNELNLSVPGEIAVIGIDNDELVCNTSTPTISSVEPDFHLAGRLAAESLDRLLYGMENASVAPIFYGPRGVVSRESTRRVPNNRKLIGEMVEFIRVNARYGIRVGDVLEIGKAPKSTLELHFRQTVGRSIAEEIQRVRLESVCTLLRHSSTPIASIAEQCGYRNDNHLKNLFKRKFGLTMSAYRSGNDGCSAARSAPPHLNSSTRDGLAADGGSANPEAARP